MRDCTKISLVEKIEGRSMNPFLQILKSQNVVILDGALGTELERNGYSINDTLWSAKFLMENPLAIARVHEDYLRSGADCITTASYQASFEGFMKKGLSKAEAKKLIQSAIVIAQNVRDSFWEEIKNDTLRSKPLVAASIGPYGAFLADGSEFRGHYGVSIDVLKAFHRERLACILETSPDVLACETIPCLDEAKVLCAVLSEFPKARAWISFSAKDGQHINSGVTIAECAQWLDTQEQIVAIGINCTAPHHIESLIESIKAVTCKPMIVYPNGGAQYDALSKTWSNHAKNTSYGTMAQRWYEKGARIIGGCCQTTPNDIADIARWVRKDVKGCV